MAYTPVTPNAYDTSLIPQEVRNQYFEEILLLSPLSMFMGDSPESVIQVIYKKDGTGPTTTFAFSREIDYKNPIFGYDQISGRGQNLKFYEDTISVVKQAIPDILKGIQITQLNTPIDVYNAMKPRLQTAHKRNLVYSLLRSATVDAYPNLGVGPVANRVLYGNSDAYNASITAAVAAMSGVLPTQSGLSVKGIRKLRDMAILGGNTFEADKRISPYMLKTREGFASPFYVYFMDTPSYQSLTKDDDFKGFFNRGTIEMPNQPSGLMGSFFKGQIDNVLLYEVPELGNFQVTSTNTASWNMLCGAQAFGLVWHKEPWFTQEFSNHNTIVEMAIHEMRGQKSIMFPSFQNESVLVENGIIHNLVQIG
jgi:hypothetical protein